MIALVCVVFTLLFILLAILSIADVKSVIEERNYAQALGMILLSSVTVWFVGFLLVIGFDIGPSNFEFADGLAAIYFVIIGLVCIRLNYLVHHTQPKSDNVSNDIPPPQDTQTQEEQNHQYWKNYYND